MKTKAELQVVAERLAEIEAKNGGLLTPNDVLQDAKSVSSPLHSYFDWNDKKAANSWRIEQARTLIRSVRVIVTTEKTAISIVAYVRDPDQEASSQGYTSILRLRTDADRSRAAIVEEFSRAAAALRRARELAIVLNLAEDIDVITDKLETTRKKLIPDIQLSE